MRNTLVLAFVALASATPAYAADYVENLTMPITITNPGAGNGSEVAMGHVSFAPITLGAGDQLTLNVTFDPTYGDSIGANDIELNVGRESGSGDSKVHIAYPYEFDIPISGAGFTLNAFVTETGIGPPTSDSVIVVDSVSAVFGPAPEPTAWVYLLVGLAMAGLLQPSRLRRTAFR